MSTLKTNNIQHVDRSDPSIIINTDGSVNIAGTMTYEDVTNVDAVGIITGRSNIDAQKQVHVGTGVSVKAGGINVTAGITTVQALQATTGTFSGQMQSASAVVTGGITATGGNIVMNDSSGSSANRIKLGTSQDLELYHTGSHSFIEHSGTGHLILGGVPNGNNVDIMKAGYSEYMARFKPDSSVDLYYDANVRFQTTPSGADVTGTLNVTGVSTHTGLAQFANTINLTHASAGSNYIYFNEDLQLAKNGTGTRLKIDTNGRLLTGHDTALTLFHGPYGTNKRNPHIQVNGTTVNSASMSLTSWDDNVVGYYGPAIFLAKSGSSTIGTNSRLNNANSILGSIIFSGDDGDEFIKGAMIQGAVDGATGGNDMPGRLMFHTTADAAQEPTERLRIGADGTLTKYYNSSSTQAIFPGVSQVNGVTGIPSQAGTPFVVARDTGTTRSAHFAGNLKFDSGYGIDFSPTGGGSNTSNESELFNDYESGSCTILIHDAAGSNISVTNNSFKYTKIGNRVFIGGHFTFAETGSKNGGLMVLYQLPFVPAQSIQATGTFWYDGPSDGADITGVIYVSSNSNGLGYMKQSTTVGQPSNNKYLTFNEISANNSRPLHCSFSYNV